MSDLPITTEFHVRPHDYLENKATGVDLFQS